jgi:hypothetical protein
MAQKKKQKKKNKNQTSTQKLYSASKGEKAT